MRFQSSLSALTLAVAVEAAAVEPRATTTTTSTSSTTTGPNWFQTTPELYAGTTETGSAPFLAETNPVTFTGVSYTPNYPLQTSEPIQGANGQNIFHWMGNLSPYYPSVDGFGVEEYPLPSGTNITQMHLLQRHGSRYPSSSEGLATWGEKIMNLTAKGTKFTDNLAFLNDWSYGLGLEILVARGRQELFDSGILNWYNYGKLYNSSSSHKLVARTTTEDRMLKSAENFLAGFFGLDWTEYANLLPIIEEVGYNNSLIGMYACDKALEWEESSLMMEPIEEWMETYLKDITATLKKQAGGYDWTVADSYDAQALCAYETVSFGYSPFCELFDFAHWKDYSYLIDIEFAVMSGFASPAGRAQGIAWVEEFLARVQGHLLTVTDTDANMTLDTNEVTFPTDQTLYFDFAHDASIVSTLTAFGFEQFAGSLPVTGPPADQEFFTSKIVPFAGRINIEIIRAPHKVPAKRPTGSQAEAYVAGTSETYYVHFLLNQRTLPLHSSFTGCEYRDDGWCELDTFLAIQKDSLAQSQFDYACNGNYTFTSYGTVTNGVPA
ncbi:hypothetical protein ASPZODRAFT_143661 [Penicilliopsis zonata CBS 506.65]|uniref:3-phytase n=1 Tax=Penicilliopsis zonata CBS 506.65 TaxID=1073090 RepID=A0A1L9SF34_9EURO|nr:hypothetical protein ASPZODRAFT_143661 [Penicilliopsis zonata CBS 506.65]OJJ45779.1 hypothetical protein ASPZODRAFT_143661 [Penicilliopsis zonata CBS 506.65]